MTGMVLTRTILSFCDYTGNWSRPYADAGYDVRCIDLKNGGGDVRLFEHVGHPVHGILAAPPCTAFAGSGAQYWLAKDASGETIEGLSIVDACLRAVAIYRPAWWALENPVGRLRRWLGPPRLMFHPWEYARDSFAYECGCGYSFPENLGKYGCPNCEGDHTAELVNPDAYTKKTLLWGSFTEPTRRPSEPVRVCSQGSWVQRLGGKSERTKELRSATPMGFARAFFEANP